MGITQPIKSDVVDKAIAPQYRDPKGHWLGLAMRARVVYASKERVKQDAITYEELSDPKWKGKICIRSGQHQYNNALFAAYIVHHGEAKAEEWLKGIKANSRGEALGRRPRSGARHRGRQVRHRPRQHLLLGADERQGDRAQAVGRRHQGDPADLRGRRHAREPLGVVLAKHAPNKANAMKLIEWLVGDHAQHLYADMNYEYPLRAGVDVNKTIAGYGKLNADKIPLVEVANKKKARREPRRQGRV